MNRRRYPPLVAKPLQLVAIPGVQAFPFRGILNREVSECRGEEVDGREGIVAVYSGGVPSEGKVGDEVDVAESEVELGEGGADEGSEDGAGDERGSSKGESWEAREGVGEGQSRLDGGESAVRPFADAQIQDLQRRCQEIDEFDRLLPDSESTEREALERSHRCSRDGGLPRRAFFLVDRIPIPLDDYSEMLQVLQPDQRVSNRSARAVEGSDGRQVEAAERRAEAYETGYCFVRLVLVNFEKSDS